MILAFVGDLSCPIDHFRRLDNKIPEKVKYWGGLLNIQPLFIAVVFHHYEFEGQVSKYFLVIAMVMQVHPPVDNGGAYSSKDTGQK